VERTFIFSSVLNHGHGPTNGVSAKYK